MSISHLVTHFGYLSNHISVTYTRSYSLGPQPQLGRTRQAFSVARSAKISLEVCGENDRAKSRGDLSKLVFCRPR